MTMQLEVVQRLSRDLRIASTTLTNKEARYLVDSFYQMQEDRKRSDNQVRALSASEEPSEVIGWLASQADVLEREIRKALAAYSQGHPVGRWAESIVGIGPIISAGLLAHIDITKAPTVGHIWRFAGLDPTLVWEKGQKRPYNAALKTLCWKIGESFVKVSNNEGDIYGHAYTHRKALEIQRNEAGLFAEQAQMQLTRFKIGKETEAHKWYSVGMLPPAHIHARAKRYAVKLFLAHWHSVAFEVAFGTPPPKPYVISILGHADYIGPPNW